MGKKLYYNIIVPVKLKTTYTYSLDRSLVSGSIVGCRVLVSFNNRTITGLVLKRTTPEKGVDYKDIIDILDPKPIIEDDLIRLIVWMSDYYLTDIGRVLNTVLPKFLLNNFEKYYKKSPLVDLETLSFSERIIFDSLPQKDLYKSIVKIGDDYILNSLIDKGAIEIFYDEIRKVREKKVLAIEVSDKGKAYLEENRGKLSKTSKVMELLDFISYNGGVVKNSDLISLHGFSTYAISKGVKLGLLKKGEEAVERIPSALFSKGEGKENPIVLNDQQLTAISEVSKSVEKGKFDTFLLYGVTGSGKTEVYIEIVKKVLSMGKSAIVLIPEISLAPQTVGRFKKVFENRIAILHSRLSDGERYDSWKQIQNGRYDVVIGVRSAIFAPIKNLGVIIVDEEHERTYKQSDTEPCYNAGNLAILRSKFNSAVTVLGSATPSLESYHNAITGKYKLLTMTKRGTGAKLPRISLITLDKSFYSNLFHPHTVKKMKEEIDKGRKVIIFHNRRGYASYQICKKCGYIEHCDSCAVSMTYHLNTKELICHQCGSVKKTRVCCSSCGDQNIVFRGVGTEQVEEEIKRIFPNRGVVRMDIDTTRKKDSHSNLLNRFRDKDISFLLGTQMISKGLDIEDVSLVVIVNGDISFIMPDFRSDEFGFQQLVQVAGRSGRGRYEGEVIIQTFEPSNKIFKYTEKQDFLTFSKNELKSRKEFNYPPFSKIIKLNFSNKSYDKLTEDALYIYEKLSGLGNKFVVYYPVDCIINKINNSFKKQIIIRSDRDKDPNGNGLREAIKKSIVDYFDNSSTRIFIDVDPLNIV
ncbi:MAG: primosomal protein N' [Candidatus Cloacimonadota bacterium]|nr:MAG: primosomal protein N' [Candidatus Cloacimonadota bacterium]PIE78513.1 MAG: primosomal protein N' [Candidatus Delongbacteria bacterium]